MDGRRCLICDTALATHNAHGLPTRLNQRYCSPRCARRAIALNVAKRRLRAQGLLPHVSRFCLGCGAELPDASNRFRDYCGPACRGKHHAQRKHEDAGSERLDVAADRITKIIEAWAVYLRKTRAIRLDAWQCLITNRYDPE